jgi:hypothetical protein
MTDNWIGRGTPVPAKEGAKTDAFPNLPTRPKRWREVDFVVALNTKLKRESLAEAPSLTRTRVPETSGQARLQSTGTSSTPESTKQVGGGSIVTPESTMAVATILPLSGTSGSAEETREV